MKSIQAPWQIANLPKETPVLLALSGGADSSFLLHLLKQQSVRDGFSLYAAHLEHGIRGEESLRDADFCKRLAEKNGVKLFLKQVDIPTLAKKSGEGIEETARKIRYQWMQELMQTQHLPILVTAHHADDQMETVLFRLCRGSGLKGLCAIAPCRPFAGGVLVRPLLELSRKDILNACQTEKIDFVEDSTNSDIHYARNFIRATVIPALEEVVEHPQKQIFRTVKFLAEDEECLQQLAKQTLKNAQSGSGLKLSVLKEAPLAILKRVLELWIPVPLESVHLEGVCAQIQSSPKGSFVSLPQHLRTEISFGCLVLAADDWRNQTSNSSAQVVFSEGTFENFFGIWRLKVEKLPTDAKIHNFTTHQGMIFHIKTDIIKSSLYWRLPIAGDELLQGGMHKKIGKLGREKGLSLTLRKNLPLLCDENGIVWAPMLGSREEMGSDGDTFEIILTSTFLPA